MVEDIQFVSILGINVHNVTMSEAVTTLEKFIHSGKSHLVVTLGTEMVVDARSNQEIRDFLNHVPSLVLPDGGGLLWASKLLGAPLKEKVAGIDLVEKLCELSETKGWKLFFLGGKTAVAELAAKNLQVRFPKANIVGTHHGYFLLSEIMPILAEARPDILLAGMGFPRQELWLSEHLERLNIPVGIGVGGSFDVMSGHLKRAPSWIRKLNLEWLFRFLQEPCRFRRILKIPFFMFLIYSQIFRDKFLNRRNS